MGTSELYHFPRKLIDLEKKLLFAILPAEKPGYNAYIKLIEKLVVIGSGRFGENNFVLGNADDKPDLSVSSAPVFALGTIISETKEIDIIIHEYDDEKIEFDITGLKDMSTHLKLTIDKINTLSSWAPGEKAPYDGSQVFEYEIVKNEYILCIADQLRKIWLHNYNSGVNHIIPVTNFFNELMRVKNIRDPKLALSPSILFEKINDFSSGEIIKAFLLYNKYLSKFKLPDQTEEPNIKKTRRKYFKFLRKD